MFKAALILVIATGFGLLPAQAGTTERVPGLLIHYPDTWTTGRELTDAVELSKSRSDGTVEVRLIFQYELRLDGEDLIRRAVDLITPKARTANFVILKGWPAVIQESAEVLPQRQSPSVSPPLPAVRHSIAVLVGSILYRGDGYALRELTPDTEREVRDIFAGLTFLTEGDEAASRLVLERLSRSINRTAAPPPQAPRPTQNPRKIRSPSGGGALNPAGAASMANTGRGELEVAVSRLGQNVVVATNNGTFSSQAGSPLQRSNDVGAPPSNDPSVSWASSGSFYETRLGGPAPGGCFIALGRSDDQGRSFNWNLGSPRFCAEPPANNDPAKRCFPDQEHLYQHAPPNQDFLVVVWREYGNLGAVTSSPRSQQYIP